MIASRENAWHYDGSASDAYQDRETNVAYNINRDYDPSIGRYVESDLIGLRGGINTYLYVGGNPISRADLRGLDFPGGIGGIGGPPASPQPLPYDPNFGPNNCSHYPPGILHDICSGTPNNPNMNCARKCLQQSYPGGYGGPPQDYGFWLIPQHPICWWECKVTPTDFCPAK